MGYKEYIIEFRLSDGTIRKVPIQIPLGPEGKPGESAWEAAVKAGYPDSEEQFYQDLAKVNDPFTYDDFTEEQLASLKGNPGESAYEAAVKGGYTGTLEQFYEDLAKKGQGSEGGVDFETDETLKLENGILSVNTTNDMEQDNTLPITSAGVYATVGNIEALLKTI